MRVLLAAAVAAVLATPGVAHADIFVSPFLGLKFKGSDQRARLRRRRRRRQAVDRRRRPWLVSDKGPGIEAEVGYNPRFFERGTGDLVTRSGVTTLFGNFVLALPISITRESLRPYAVAGLGWVHASANDLIGFSAVSNDFLGLALGGGAIGFVSDVDRPAVRPALPEERVLGRRLGPAGPGLARISFWRATVGVVFR